MRVRKPSRRRTSPFSALPTIIGPPAPVSRRATRRRIALAELGLFDHQIPQPPRRDDKRLGGFRGKGIDQRRAAGQLRKLAHERARTMPHDRFGISVPAALRDIDPAPQDEESARRNLAGRNHALPGHIGFALTEPFQRSISSGSSTGKICSRRVAISGCTDCGIAFPKGRLAPTCCLTPVHHGTLKQWCSTVLDENLVAWAGLVSGSLHELIGCLVPVSRSAAEPCEESIQISSFT